MIPSDFIAEWRAHTRWATNEQVEQDLVLSRALVSIFEDRELAGTLALRGGTALHKLHFSPPRRYSNDIDLAAGATRVADELIARLPGDPWKGRQESG